MINNCEKVTQCMVDQRQSEVIALANRLFVLECIREDAEIVKALQYDQFSYLLYFGKYEISIPHNFINFSEAISDEDEDDIAICEFIDDQWYWLESDLYEYYEVLEKIKIAMLEKLEITDFDTNHFIKIQPLLDSVGRKSGETILPSGYVVGNNCYLDILSHVTLNDKPVLYLSFVEVYNDGFVSDRAVSDISGHYYVASYLANKTYADNIDEHIMNVMLAL